LAEGVAVFLDEGEKRREAEDAERRGGRAEGVETGLRFKVSGFRI
jgi:hypothetical protein